MRQTLGEYKVGISFNPSGNQEVDAIKKLAAVLIDTINGIAVGDDATDATVSEVMRLKALAMTHVETAAMFAVKAATKPERN